MNRPIAGDAFGLVWDFNQKSFHGVYLLLKKEVQHWAQTPPTAGAGKAGGPGVRPGPCPAQARFMLTDTGVLCTTVSKIGEFLERFRRGIGLHPEAGPNLPVAGALGVAQLEEIA